MKTPDEIKTALKYLGMTDISEKLKLADDVAYAYQEEAVADALAYIQRLEAELIATRVRLGKDGDLCRICCTQRAQDCAYDCNNCDNAGCGCKRCIDTDGIEGFEWDGVAT